MHEFCRHYGVPGAYVAVIVGKGETVVVPPGVMSALRQEKRRAVNGIRDSISGPRDGIITVI